MMAERNELEKLVDELLPVLDEDVRLLEKSLSQLDELRGYVIKRDESSLRALLESIEGEQKAHTANESKRQRLRGQLAAAVGCSVDVMNLSKLQDCVGPDRQVALCRRKTKLNELVEKLGMEHFSTAMLLSECARLNKLLLKSIFDLGSRAVTYSADGNTKWQADRSIISAKV